MDHKKALLKILKWAGSFFISILFSAPIIIVLLIGGMVMALFGKSSKSSSEVTFTDTVSVTATAAYICEYFSEAGYTDIQIAAILGNLQWESGLNPNSYTELRKGGTAMGIAEWTTYSGTNSLELFAESKGMEWNDLELQCMAIDATLHGQNPYSGWENTMESRRQIFGKVTCMMQRCLFSVVLKIQRNIRLAAIIMDMHRHRVVCQCHLIVEMVMAACHMRKSISITWKVVIWEVIPVLMKRKMSRMQMKMKKLYRRNQLAAWRFRYICRETMHQ